MIAIQSSAHIARISGSAIFNFLISPTDREYQRWWPGVHLKLHLLKQRPSHIGDVIYMDEFVGRRRVKMIGVVVEAEPGKKIVWQLKQFLRLPVWLILELRDDQDGVTITHTIRAGFAGIGKVFDFIFRAYFTDDFAKAMDEHFRLEFPKLRDLLLPKS